MLFYLAAISDTVQRGKFEEIYIKHRKVMFYEAKSILKDETRAEDAVHKAFEKLLKNPEKNLQKIHDVDSHKTKYFLVTTVKRVAIDMYNETRRQEAVSIEEAIDIADSTQLSVQDIVMNDDNCERLIQAVTEKLPDIYRDPFLLKYAYGYDNEEIAHILNINEHNVRKRLQVAREKLKEILGGEGAENDQK